MTVYWVSAIVQYKSDEKPRLLAMYNGEVSLDKAMKVVSRIKENHTVISVWVDAVSENKVKQTVFHECYINAFGDIKEDKK